MLEKLRELDFFSLMVFKTISDTRHANVAAQQLAVSPSKVSRCLNSMRHLLDDELFYRRQQGLLPTPLAERLYQPVCKVLASYQQFESQVYPVSNEQQSKIKIGVCSLLLPALALRLHQLNNNYLLSTIDLFQWSSDSIEKINQGELDIGVCFERNDSNNITYETLGNIKSMSLVAANNHPVWANIDNFSLELMCDYPFYYVPTPGLNKRVDPIEAYCHQQGITPPSIESCVDREELYAKLLTGPGLTFSGPKAISDFNANMPGLSVFDLPQQQVDAIHACASSPMYRLVERMPIYRRYDDEMRTTIINILKQMIN
ncbi:LysR family transcriptional regulator [Ferrimonas lipolytica]|uniref:LysR family transcriptional regulator n=1 Tax=Ferrimonas lipolytica TaxID=2724191 RepID=A0A6H1UHH4_9GAMM|nr:LysR family transcriptional regulator [Ferrimonas lipolytica]QIZ77242.1 LysR family transcriptional regulator [Ferrimonas lipolytica]